MAELVLDDTLSPAPAPAAETSDRLPYATPTLRYLGTVYELTLAGPGSATEGVGFPKPRAS